VVGGFGAMLSTVSAEMAVAETAATGFFAVLSEFTSLYGIGPGKARELYDQGYRTLDELQRHFEDWEARTGKESGMIEALKLRDELAIKIPRAEVEEMAGIVMMYLNRIRPGFQYTICGGYRRGKEFSNDVDILFSRPTESEDEDNGICMELVRRLQAEGLVTHAMRVSSFSSRRGPLAQTKRL